MKKRVLAIFLAVALAIGMLPTAMAEQDSQNGGGAEASSSTVTNGAYGSDGVWAEGGNGTSIVTLEDGTEVQLSKTAQPVAGDPNSFDVTLQVVTTQSTITQTGSGAVVLVIDVSGSMDFCATCGGDEEHIKNKNYQCPYYNKKDNDVTKTQTRLYAAKAAALDFLKSYAGTDAGANRQLAIVAFSTWYSIELNWSNVAGGTGKNSYDQAVSAINKLKAGGGTNLDAGLYAANNLLANDTVKDISSKSVILLTDGVPTYRRDPENPDDPDEVLGWGSSGSKKNNEAAATQAAAIKSAGAELYTVCYGVADDETYDGGPTVGNFLKESIASENTQDKTYAFNAANADELNKAFKSITESITSGLNGDGLQVTDPMGDMIIGPASSDAFPTEDGKTYTWTLTGADTSVDNGVTTYIYTYTYRVTVDVQDPNFKEDTFYPTNKPTYLTIGEKNYYFPVPGVKGELPRTSVTVTKKWVDGNDQDGIRPSSVTVQLCKDGTPYGDPVTLNNTNQWSFTWTDLIAKSGGKVHAYTVVENLPNGYGAEVTGDASTGFIITNTELTSVTVTKDWKDAAKQDERPTEITVQLVAKVGEDPIELANVETECTLTSSEEPGDNWTHTWENLPKYDANNQPITYSVVELNVPAGYVSTPGTANNNYTITNTLTGKVEVTVTKQWVDGNDQDGIRPKEITVQLFANGNEYGDPVTLNASKTDDKGNWIYTWDEEFEKYDENGEEITYTAQETQVLEDYSVSYDGLLITNTHVPATTSVKVTKIWEDNGNQDNKRPEQVTVKLQQTVLDENGEEVTTDVIRDDAEVTLSVNGWTYTWENLPVYESGQKITYSVVETDVDDYYDVSYRSAPDEDANIVYLTVTNTAKAYETTSVTITKVWDDAGNQDGKRPDSITVNLMSNESVLNTYEIGLADGALRPEVSEDGNTWTYTIEGLTKNSAGKPISYSITEDQVAGYDEPVITGNAADGYTIKNSRTPESITIKGTKTWEDYNNQDNKRPESITVKLMNGDEVVATAEVSEQTDWKYSFTVPKYSNGTEIEYYIAEVAVDNYTTTYSEDGFDIINTHAPEKTSVTVQKVWDDADDQDGLRPDSITVYLMNGDDVVGTAEITEAEDGTWSHTFENLDKYSNGQKIQYTVSEKPVAGYDTDISQVEGTNTFVITNSHSPAVIEKITVTKVWEDDKNSDGSRPDSVTINLVKTVNGESSVADSLTLSADNQWAGAFENLPANKDGKAIVYTVTEDEVPGYTTVITGSAAEGFTVTNSHTPETVDVSGVKIWLDNFDQDGIRPDSVTIRLYANGKYVGKQVVTRASGWTYSFTDLPKYDNGEPIVYTITEDPVKGYVTTYTITPFGYDVTNTHVPAVTAIGGTKVWDDAHDQDGKRPDSIVVNLYANGIYVTSQVVSEATDWNWFFGPLAKYYDHGKLVIYTVTENAVDGYTTEIVGNKIINSYTPEETSVTVMKVWDDADNQDGIRANDIVVKLLADGKDTGLTAVLSAGNDWTATFTGLDKYRDGGIEIVYTVEEAEVPEGYEVSYSIDADGIKVVNTHTPETVTIEGSKTWDDNDNQDGMRPEYITIRLYADGVEVASKLVTEADDWSWSFEDLPKYKAGVEIVYSITEDAVENYTAEVDGFDVTNTHTPGKTFVNVIKTWNDKDNQDGIRPDSVKVHLYANGEPTDLYLTLSDENAWTGVFSDLDEYQNGEAVKYTVKEIEVEGYDTVITGDAATGYTISNTHIPETVGVSGAKTWDDNDNQDGKRPDSITVNLLANGVEIGEAVVTAEDGWTYSFEDLPKFEDGTEISYTITEDLVEGYTVAVNGYDLVNSYTPGKTTVTVTKAWSDSNDKDGLRPDSVTIKLLANGVDTGKTLVLTAEGNWTGIFTDLDEYKDGEKIVYTVAEDVVKGYNAVISGDAATGFIVTNSHTTTPKTGDSAMPFLMGGIGAAALVLFLGLLLAKRKKEEY